VDADHRRAARDPQLLPDGTGAAGAGGTEFVHDTNNVSGKIGADWKASEDLLTYASISQGYRGVAFNGQASTIRPSSLSRARRS